MYPCILMRVNMKKGEEGGRGRCGSIEGEIGKGREKEKRFRPLDY